MIDENGYLYSDVNDEFGSIEGYNRTIRIDDNNYYIWDNLDNQFFNSISAPIVQNISKPIYKEDPTVVVKDNGIVDENLKIVSTEDVFSTDKDFSWTVGQAGPGDTLFNYEITGISEENQGGLTKKTGSVFYDGSSGGIAAELWGETADGQYVSFSELKAENGIMGSDDSASYKITDIYVNRLVTTK